MPTMKPTDAFIEPDDLVTVTSMGAISEVQYMKHRNHTSYIRKLNADQYVDLDSGEVKEFKHIENRGESLNSIRQTIKKLGYLINNNFFGAKNELWITLTCAENETDPNVVSYWYKLFAQRLKRYTDREFGKKGQWEALRILEPQERGAWHVHLLLKFPKRRSVFIPKKTLAELWQKGFVDIHAIHETDNLGAYLTSYLTDTLVDQNEDGTNNANYVFSPVKEDGSEGIAPLRVDSKQAKKKGGRLKLYSPGMNIFSKTRGITYPKRKTMRYSDVFTPVEQGGLGFQLENLALRRAVEIEDKEHDFTNIIVKEQFNPNVNDRSANNPLFEQQFAYNGLAYFKEHPDDDSKKFVVPCLEATLFQAQNKTFLREQKREYFKNKSKMRSKTF